MYENESHPKYTARLIGHEAVEAQFYRAWESMSLHHAWMLCGPQGVGKATLAWHMARFLLKYPVSKADVLPDRKNSLHIDSDDPIFTRVNAGGHADFRVVERVWDEDGKRFRHEITIEQIRKAAQFFEYSAAEGGWRICIIDAIDEMNAYGINALLKILEEPPQQSILILIAHRFGRVPITIRSRCIKAFIHPLSKEQMQSAMTDEGDVADRMIDLAMGCPGRIKTMLNEGKGGYDAFVAFEAMVQALPTSLSVKDMLNHAKTLRAKNAHTHFTVFCSLLLDWLAQKARMTIKREGVGEDIFPAVKWAEAYTHIAHLISVAEEYNLDRNALLVHIFSAIEETAQICDG